MHTPLLTAGELPWVIEADTVRYAVPESAAGTVKDTVQVPPWVWASVREGVGGVGCVGGRIVLEA